MGLGTHSRMSDWEIIMYTYIVCKGCDTVTGYGSSGFSRGEESCFAAKRSEVEEQSAEGTCHDGAA
jgi:hypothetical protein